MCSAAELPIRVMAKNYINLRYQPLKTQMYLYSKVTLAASFQL